MAQQKFINRKDEIEFLERRYASRESENIVIYGRRRIGKTELVLHFGRRKPFIYFLATKDSERDNMGGIKKEMANFIDDKTFAETKADSWLNLFELFVKFRDMKNMKEKAIICIDEFPFLIQLNDAIPSLFQKIWDTVLKDNNIMLILSGSSISMMEDKVLSYKSPLYGRRTGQWGLMPISIRYLGDFFPKSSMEELCMAWSILGGVPAYLNKFNLDNVWDNLKMNLLTKGNFLYDETEILLRDEFREPKNYKLILKAISMGCHNLGEICNQTGLDKSMVSKYLDVLQKTHIVEEQLPITASLKAKKRWYFITDPFFSFWFRFVYPNKISLEAKRIEEVLNSIKNGFPDYMGPMFERLCRTLISEKLVMSDINFTKIGRWWHKEREIDIAALNENGKGILFAECKWQENVDAEEVYNALLSKKDHVEWHNDERKEHFAVFAKSFRKRIRKEGLLLFDLKDIEKACRA